MKGRMMGVETEYAITGLGRDGKPQDAEALLGRMLALARSRLQHLPDFNRGMFLANGSRLYVDAGLHPEIGTPECEDPRDVVSHVRAGERILTTLVRELQAAERALSGIVLLKGNVDYWATGSTWGCHESYMLRGDQRDISSQLIPHLVSRVIYTGAGGFHPRSPGLEFSLSPRVGHLEKSVSRNSTHGRGIFHTKNESLAGKRYNRLHVICGESLNSELGAWLKLGVTALIVALIEHGLAPGEEVQLLSPLESMRVVAADPGCGVSLALTGAVGRRRTAIDIQRHYLAEVERALDRDFMPDWAGSVASKWREILDQLERDPLALWGTLDWPLKHVLYEEQIRQEGFDWDSLRRWNQISTSLLAALTELGQQDRIHDAPFLLGARSPVAGLVAHLTPNLQSSGLSWDDLGRYHDLRVRMLETDVRFGQLEPEGTFHKLDDGGHLEHRLDPPLDVDTSMNEPPAVGRARLRGEMIRSLCSKPGRYLCDWQGIWDPEDKKMMNFSDPFTTSADWEPAEGMRHHLRRRFDLPPWSELLGL